MAVEPLRQKIFARCALAAFALTAFTWLGRLDYANKISTNVLDLIPPAEQSPEIGVVRALAGDRQARVMLFSVRDPAAPQTPPVAAARLLADELGRSPAFAEAMPLGGGDDATLRIGRQIFDRRWVLLLPSWLGDAQREFSKTGRAAREFSPWLADRSAADLERFLVRPEAAAMANLLPSDPLLLIPRVIDRARSIGSPGADAGGAALVWARIQASPLDEAGQRPVFAAVDLAFARVRAAHPGLELRWTGVNRFAAASRRQIESEIKTLNFFSIAAVLIVGAMFVRRTWKMLHLVPVILCSLLGAWSVSTAVFDRLHVLVFVIGSLLSGVAIDYGFYIYMQPSLRPGERYADKLGRLLKPLLASCLTTVIGFSLLLFSDLPFIRQVGLFVAAGLVCALGAAMLYFAQLDRPFLEARQFGRMGGGRDRPWIRWGLRSVLLLAAIVALAGPWRLRWSDDIHELQIPTPELAANDQALRTLFGDSTDRSVYLTYGATVAEARRHLEDFLADEARTSPDAGAASVGLIFPTETDWRELPARLGGLRGFSDDFRAALDRHGFRPESFEPFFTAWNRVRSHPPSGDYDGLYADFAHAAGGPLTLLYEASGPLCWFLTTMDGPEAPPPAGVSTVSVNQIQSLNRLFARYRWSALRLSLCGLGLVIASVFVIYPFRRGLRIALIPAGSCFFILGVLGLAGQTLNLFNLLGAFLGVCLSHNYAIFSSDQARTGSAPPASIRLSALCTAASFGVLAFSRIPVVHALGLTVALIVLTSLSVVELEPLGRGQNHGAREAP
jgi:predicted exporter